MYENILHQEVTSQLQADIAGGTFPNSVLLAGNEASGKLTIALETARVISCRDKGQWQCNCPSCRAIRSLTSPSIMLMGSRDCSLEIAAAKSAFIKAVLNEASYIDAARHLFLRAVRKLTMRFNPILLEGDSNLSKANAIISSINELMDKIDYPAVLPDTGVVEKTVDKIEEHCQKLESTLLYDTIPIGLVRNVSYWSHLMIESGKRVIIIEGADRLMEGARNSLLKILEEPPFGSVFILTTAHRSAVMSTILSRVRTYTLRDRSMAESAEVIERVFHAAGAFPTIKDYLNTFLPVSPDTIKAQARKYVECIALQHYLDAGAIVKSCASFKPRVLLNVFMEEVLSAFFALSNTQNGAEAAAECFRAVRECVSAVCTYNIGATAALERLYAVLLRINYRHEGVMSL